MNHILLKAALAAALFLLPSASPAAENVKILSGPTSGVWYVGMGAAAEILFRTPIPSGMGNPHAPCPSAASVSRRMERLWIET